MAVLNTYRRVFANADLARLLVGEFVSSIGDWLYLVALLVIVYQRENSAVVLGIVGALRVAPYVFLSVPAGILVDRVDRRLVLLVTDIARGVVMLGLALLVAIEGPLWAILVLTLLAASLSTFFGPAIGAYLPTLVKDESEIGPANSAWASLDNLGFIVGPAIAGLLIAVGGLTLAFVINAASFGIVALVLWRLPKRPPGGAGATGEASDGPGIRALLGDKSRALLGIGIVNVVGQFIFGGLSVLTVVIAIDVLKAGEAATGYLNAAIGLGGLIGAVLSGVLVLRRRLGPPLLLGALLFGGGLVAVGFSGSLALALVGMAVLSVGDLLLNVVNTTLIQRIVPDAVRGRVFGGLHTITVGSYAIGSLLIPIATLVGGLPLVFGIAGGAIVVAVGAAVGLLGDAAVQGVKLDDRRAVLLTAPAFAGLPPGRLEEAAGRAEVRDAAAATVIIRQGEPADLAYVISAGEVEVTQQAATSAPSVLRRMGAGEVFGEIGLLSGGPRTATVTAVTPVTLLALDRATFLDLVSAPAVTSRLVDRYGGAGAMVAGPASAGVAAPAEPLP
ncbi:MAG: MFS transporter [Chloroflexota bacterium]